MGEDEEETAEHEMMAFLLLQQYEDLEQPQQSYNMVGRALRRLSGRTQRDVNKRLRPIISTDPEMYASDLK